VPHLLRSLGDASTHVRTTTAVSLGRIGDPRALEPLCRALEDPQRAVRDAAFAALLVFEERAAGALCEALRRGSWDRSHAVTDALTRIGPTAIPELTKLIDSPVWQVRQEAVIALGRIGSSVATPHLVHTLGDDSEGVRGRAAAALGHIRTPDAVNALIRTLEDRSPSVRLHAAAALGHPGSPEAVDALIACLTHPDHVLRVTAARALGRAGSGRATLPLVAALEGTVGFPAAQALHQIAERDPIPELRAALPALHRTARVVGFGTKQMAYCFALIDRIEKVTRALGSLPLPARPPAATDNLPRTADGE
jgi:HEAT repeat protein